CARGGWYYAMDYW
nr:immunoglobulin heavy chain junction region [Mus musculus]